MRFMTDLRSWISEGLFDSDASSKLERGAEVPTTRKWRELFEVNGLGGVLPYEYFDEEDELFYNDDSFGFLIELAPAVGITEDSIRVLSSIFTTEVEPDTAVQICLYASPDCHHKLQSWADARTSPEACALRDSTPGNQNHDVFRKLTQRRLDRLLPGAWEPALENQPYLIRDFRLFLSVNRPLSDGPKPSKRRIKAMRRFRESIHGTLNSASIAFRDMNATGFINLLDTVFNATDRPRTPLRHDKGLLLREQVVHPDTATLVTKDGLVLRSPDRDVDVRCFKVREYPAMWAGWNMGDLIGSFMDNNRKVACPFMVTLTVHIPDQAAAASEAKLKSARATQMVDTDMGKYVPSWVEKKDEWTFVQRKLDEGHTMVQMGYQVVLFAPLGSGEVCENQLIGIYKASGWNLARQKHIAGPALLSALPLSAGPKTIKESKQFFKLRAALSWTAANCAPWLAEWKGSRFPLLMMFGRRGQATYLDPWENREGNYNISVAATSGAGKSFFTSEMIASVLGVGGRVWAFDRGRSYEHLCKLLDGEFIEFGPESKLCLNPFTGIRDYTSEGIMLKQVVAQMISTEAALPSVQMGMIEQALKQVWEAKGNQAEMNDVYTALLASEDRRARDMAQSLFSYTTEGLYGHYFNGPANIDLNNDFVVLETQELDAIPQLQVVIVLMLIMQVTQAMYLGDRKRRKLCLIDEAWKLLGRGNAGEFIEEGYRTARKFEGAFMTITQSVDDFFKSPTTRAAFEFADYTYLLRQKPSSVEAMIDTKKVPMGAAGKDILNSIHTVGGSYSELAAIGPNGMAVVRFISDKFTEKLYSTRGDEFAEIEERMAQGMDLTAAIESMVREAA